MPAESWYSLNLLRFYPLREKSSSVPKNLLVDAGVWVGPSVPYNQETDQVKITSVEWDGTDGSIEFTRGPDDATLSIEFDSDVDPFTVLRAEQEGVWSVWLVLGDLQKVGNVSVTPDDAVISPTLVQASQGIGIDKIRIANKDRNRYRRENCPEPDWPVAPQPYWIDPDPVLGNVRFENGYNSVILPDESQNTLSWFVGPGLGRGLSCEELLLYDGEEPPPNSTTLDGAPRCQEAIRFINGQSATNFRLISGNGVDIIPDPENHLLSVVVQDQKVTGKPVSLSLLAVKPVSQADTEYAAAAVQAAVAVKEGVGGTVVIPESFTDWEESLVIEQGGPDSDNPLIIQAAADNNRALWRGKHNGPLIRVKSGYVEIRNLEILPSTRETDDNRVGIEIDGGNVVIDDCHISGWKHNVLSAGGNASQRVASLTVKQSTLSHSWGYRPNDPVASGLSCYYTDNISVEGCLFYLNGRPGLFLTSNANGRGVYVDGTCGGTYSSAGCLFAYSSNTGEEVRKSGTSSFNLFYRNPVSSVLTGGGWDHCGVASPRDLKEPEGTRPSGDGFIVRWVDPQGTDHRDDVTLEDCWFIYNQESSGSRGPWLYTGEQGSRTSTVTTSYKRAWDQTSDTSLPGLTDAPGEFIFSYDEIVDALEQDIVSRFNKDIGDVYSTTANSFHNGVATELLIASL